MNIFFAWFCNSVFFVVLGERKKKKKLFFAYTIKTNKKT